MIISVDGHVTASVPEWRAHLASRWHGLFDDWAADNDLPGSEQTSACNHESKQG